MDSMAVHGVRHRWGSGAHGRRLQWRGLGTKRGQGVWARIHREDWVWVPPGYPYRPRAAHRPQREWSHRIGGEARATRSRHWRPPRRLLRARGRGRAIPIIQRVRCTVWCAANCVGIARAIPHPPPAPVPSLHGLGSVPGTSRSAPFLTRSLPEFPAGEIACPWESPRTGGRRMLAPPLPSLPVWVSGVPWRFSVSSVLCWRQQPFLPFCPARALFYGWR